MGRIRNEITVRTPAARAWEVLADLDGVDRWIPGLSSVRVDGFKRICTFADGAVQDEEILEFSPETMPYGYRIHGGPMPLTENSGAFCVEAAGERSARVVWDAAFEVADGAPAAEVAEAMRGAYTQIADKVRRLIEEGA